MKIIVIFIIQTNDEICLYRFRTNLFIYFYSWNTVRNLGTVVKVEENKFSDS